MGNRAQRRATYRRATPADPFSPKSVVRAITDATGRYFDFAHAPELDDAEQLRQLIDHMRMFEAIAHHRLARGAFMRFLIDRFDMAEPGLWHRIVVSDDREEDAPANPSEVTFTMQLPLDGGGVLLNKAKGDGILAPLCAFVWDGDVVGEAATMADVRDLQERYRKAQE